MTSLADKALRNIAPPRVREERNYVCLAAAAELVRARLSLTSSTDPKSVAARFVFEVSPPSVVRELYRDGSVDVASIFSTASFLPHDSCWIEMPVDFENNLRGRMGYLIEELDDDKLLVVCVSDDGSPHDEAWPIAVFSMQRPPWSPRAIPVEIHGVATEEDADTVEKELTLMSRDIVDSLFVLNVPRATEVVRVRHDEKLQRARAKRGKLPLLEISRVKVLIGAPRRVYPRSGEPGATGGADGGRRRLHHVDRHLRTLRKDRETPKVVAVDGHWRGDERLGVVLREKHLERKS